MLFIVIIENSKLYFVSKHACMADMCQEMLFVCLVYDGCQCVNVIHGVWIYSACLAPEDNTIASIILSITNYCFGAECTERRMHRMTVKKRRNRTLVWMQPRALHKLYHSIIRMLD